MENNHYTFDHPEVIAMRPNEFLKFLKELNFTDELDRKSIVKSYLKNPNNENNRLGPRKFLEFLKELNFTHGFNRESIIRSYLNNPNNENNRLGPREFLKFLKELNFTNEFYRESIISSYLKNPNNENNRLGPTKLLEFLKELNFTNEFDRERIIKSYLKNPRNKISIAQFSEIIITLSYQYRPDIICGLYKTFSKNKSPQENATDLSELADKLYSTNELLRIELFKEGIDKRIINKDNISFLEFKKIDDNQIIFDFIEYSFKNKILTKENEILELVKSRVHTKYDSLKNLLNNSSLENCLTAEGFTYLNNIFEANYLANTNITISDIFSYFDVTNQISDLANLLKPEFKKQLKEQFQPSDKILLVKKEEIDKFKLLVSDNSNNIENKFVSNAILCNYFKEKISVPQLPINKDELKNYLKNYKIDFSGTALDINSSDNQNKNEEIDKLEGKELIDKMIEVAKKARDEEIKRITKGYFDNKDEFIKMLQNIKKEEGKIPDEIATPIRLDLKSLLELNPNLSLNQNDQELLKQKLNNLFKDLLLQQYPDSDQIVEFFNKALNIDTSNIGNGAGKLTEFFSKNKNELAYFFQKGGLKEFSALINTLGDGCAANISNQFNSALYGSLLKGNKADSILFQTFNQSIITPILNKSDNTDSIGTENNPLNNRAVRKYQLSTNALIKEIAKTFYDENSKPAIKEDAWELIKNQLGEKVRDKILEKITDYDQINQKAAEIVSYLILSNINPNIKEILDNSLKGKEIKNIIEVVEKEIIEEWSFQKEWLPSEKSMIIPKTNPFSEAFNVPNEGKKNIISSIKVNSASQVFSNNKKNENLVR